MTFSPRFASRTRRALVTAAALTAVAATGTATAQTKTLYIGMNGGTMEKAYTQQPSTSEGAKWKSIQCPISGL